MPREDPRLRAADGKKNQIGQRVKERSRRLGLTANALCARLASATAGEWNPGRQEIVKLMSGRRQVLDVEVVALAQVLDLDPCWLLLGGDENTVAAVAAATVPIVPSGPDGA